MTRRWLPVALIVLTAACAQQPRPAVTPQLPSGPLPGAAALQSDLSSIFQAPAFGNAVWGVLVRSLKTGDTLFALNPRTLLMPASNMKVVTMAAAGETLGWDRTFKTTLLATGPIEQGVLKGDLVVVGSGDPSLGGRPTAGNTIFDAWAADLRAKGISAIQGRIIGDDRAFEPQGLGAGWAWDFLDAAYATPTGGLNFNENTVQVTVKPGAAAGDFAAVESAPGGHDLVIENAAWTSAATAEVAISLDRAPGSAVLRVSGSLPAGHAPVVRSVSVESPTLLSVGALRRALSTSGIPVSGDAVAIRSLAAAPDVVRAVPLLTYTSPTLTQIGKLTLKVSQNLYADTLLRLMGCPAPLESRPMCTTRAGIRTVGEVLKGWGIAPGSYVMVDGSGLSRYDYLTPELLVTVLTRMNSDERHRGPFLDALPIAGVDGTISGRMRDTKAQGNARAKTGSISNARALSGFVTSADGEPLVFSMIVNNFNVSQAEADRLIDRAVVRLAEFRRR
ncbi:MAG: D-alanyl-D-alanine carboxypeptidase/D-alanyl-D-alanine-endopeptidase [Acidobacteria bacterium]|nr:D-alanyl-D-alanine carboxypeptidase/D-alanyl-D-alanine-endopeptidase [Acidobacteriota bacterium]